MLGVGVVIVALDLSPKDTGVALITANGNLRQLSIKPSKEYTDYRKLLDSAQQIQNAVLRELARFTVQELEVFVEQPFFIPGKSHPGPMYMLHGQTLQKLSELVDAANFYWNEVSVSTWRSWLLKRMSVVADSRKTDDQKAATFAALAKLGITVIDHNDNCADSVGLLLWAREALKER